MQPGLENIRVISLNHQSQWNSDRDTQSLAESMLSDIININEVRHLFRSSLGDEI